MNKGQQSIAKEAAVDSEPRVNFIRNIIDEELKDGKHKDGIITRFPPEPNGYLHIGHAKSICLNFMIAEDYKGYCNLRFDDTNPEKESIEYMKAIEEDVSWLGFQWKNLFRSSDYFTTLYNFAVQLIKDDKAYVDSLSADEIRKYRGTLTKPGKESPHRNRSIEENLKLFEEMKSGKYRDGEHVLRAKIDMGSANLNMRDPTIYRIRHITHHSTGDKWKIYPMYDYTHCLSDALENISHSLCTLEFEDHRPLYDWFIEQVDVSSHPRQIEFSRLNLQYTVMSKRKLNHLVEENYVHGFDDPRMPTIAGLRRRGYTANAIRNFCDAIGISKADSNISMTLLEDAIRDDLNIAARRAMAVLDPLKITITNYPGDKEEMITAKNHPQNPDYGTREISFSREILVERNDFMEDAPKKFFRLSVGREVRLRYAFLITCDEVIKDDKGNVIELLCSYDPATKGGNAADGRKVKGTIHWVNAKDAIKAKVKLYDRLFSVPEPDKEDDFTTVVNPDSLQVLTGCRLEPSLASITNERFQFERQGYFCHDKESSDQKLIFNRIVSLRDSWTKQR